MVYPPCLIRKIKGGSRVRRYLFVPGNETEDKRQRGETDIMNFSKRMDRFGTSIFSVLLEKKREKLARGEEVIDLSIWHSQYPSGTSYYPGADGSGL